MLGRIVHEEGDVVDRGNLTDAGQRSSLPEGQWVVVVRERELGVHDEQSGVDGVEETHDKPGGKTMSARVSPARVPRVNIWHGWRAER